MGQIFGSYCVIRKKYEQEKHEIHSNHVWSLDLFAATLNLGYQAFTTTSIFLVISLFSVFIVVIKVTNQNFSSYCCCCTCKRTLKNASVCLVRRTEERFNIFGCSYFILAFGSKHISKIKSFIKYNDYYVWSEKMCSGAFSLPTTAVSLFGLISASLALLWRWWALYKSLVCLVFVKRKQTGPRLPTPAPDISSVNSLVRTILNLARVNE